MSRTTGTRKLDWEEYRCCQYHSANKYDEHVECDPGPFSLDKRDTTSTADASINRNSNREQFVNTNSPDVDIHHDSNTNRNSNNNRYVDPDSHSDVDTDANSHADTDADTNPVITVPVSRFGVGNCKVRRRSCGESGDGIR
ncbi:hypothetical protein ACFQL7_14220 [Halocatena marina]|uniref:Uncharacterized protein n=1 Tax=Halocatena marina TaxID=2934937 RepID=A0ABD5YTN5_9EURY